MCGKVARWRHPGSGTTTCDINTWTEPFTVSHLKLEFEQFEQFEFTRKSPDRRAFSCPRGVSSPPDGRGGPPTGNPTSRSAQWKELVASCSDRSKNATIVSDAQFRPVRRVRTLRSMPRCPSVRDRFAFLTEGTACGGGALRNAHAGRMGPPTAAALVRLVRGGSGAKAARPSRGCGKSWLI